MVNVQTHGRLGDQQKVLGPLKNISQLWNEASRQTQAAKVGVPSWLWSPAGELAAGGGLLAQPITTDRSACHI